MERIFITMGNTKLQFMKYAGKIWGGGITLLLLYICLFGGASDRAYGMVLRLENAEMVNRSHVVVFGTVKGISSRKNDQEAVVSVECILKGDLSAKSEVRVVFSPGMAESPLFEVQERVLLFLVTTDTGLFQTVGGSQGKFSFGK